MFVVVQAHIFKPMDREILRGPNILRTLSRDAVIYFTVMFSSHFMIFVMFFAARVRFFCTAARVRHADLWLNFIANVTIHGTRVSRPNVYEGEL